MSVAVDNSLDWPRRRVALRLALGRHRAAIRLSLLLLAFGLAGPVLGAAADAVRGVSLIGDVVIALAETSRSSKTAVLASAIAVVVRVARTHPLAAPRMLPALLTTPWRPGRALPQGDVTLAGSMGLLPLATIAGMYAIGLPAAPQLAVGAALGYAVFALVTALAAAHFATAILLGTSLVVLVKVYVSFEPWAFVAWLVGILMLSDVAHRRAIAAAFGGARTFDVRRFNQLQRRSTLGWFENLPIERKPRRLGLELLAALAAGMSVASVLSAAGLRDAQAYRFLMTMPLIAMTGIRFFSRFVRAPLSFGLIARVMTGRWFVPRMDRLLLGPLVMLALIEAARNYAWTRDAQTDPVVAGTFLAAGLLVTLWVGPTRLAWQTTGTSRITVTPTGGQKQAEAMMKRWSEQRAAT